MRLADLVFVPSVQHTGTWFAIRFLKRFFPASRELVFALEDLASAAEADVAYEHTYRSPLGGPTVLHTHLPIVRYCDFDVDAAATRFERRWKANMGTLRSVPVQTALLVCNLLKAVVPVRDPLAAILTREARHPQFRHFYIVDGFVALATEFARHPNVVFLPVDMTEDPARRRELLVGVLEHLCLDPEQHGGVLDEMAETWAPENETPGNRFRDAYRAGDLDELRRMLGPKWAEVEYMRNMNGILLPFLRDLGYQRGDFIW